MVRKSVSPLLVACAACLPPLLTAGYAAAQTTPPYRILLRSRSGEVTPERVKDAQTGSGHIDILQREPDELVVLMRGAVVAGSDQQKGGAATMHFVLDQDFEVVPTRTGLRPPMLTLVGQVIGTLQSTAKGGGAAEQGPACAAVNSAGQPVLQFCIKPHAVAGGQELFVNDRTGPLEAPVVPGLYCLHQTFEISASEPWSLCHHLGTGAAANFDPDPRLDARWNNILKPFRAVPHRDFGFGVLVRVLETPLPTGAAPGQLPAPAPAPGKAGERLPAPRPAESDKLPAADTGPATP
jgi:hypothetical protein